ncbi:MAG: pyruvate ferredoxin oxidoreductase [Chloroflexi bacterium]|nr:pyruvate ferredoxin oxidoreductase [Chloroflexota bacterium]
MASVFVSGNMAAAIGARQAEVNVVAAYPITPQTSIVEYLAKFVADGELDAQTIPVESEHSAMAACIGASLAGARAFTASSSQGLALMHEPVFAAAGLRLPLVMAVANRALSHPVTIWSDHSDSMAERDSGWLQFYCETCQEVLDTIIIGYRVAEDARVLLPAMVCLDGFYLSHLSEPVSVPAIEDVRRFAPKSAPKYPILDVDDPKSIGLVISPDFFTEFVYDKHASMSMARDVTEEAFAEFERMFGRRYSHLESYRIDDAEVVLVGMGTMAGTIRVAVDGLRARGMRVGALKIKTYRPFPGEEIRRALRGARVVAVVDRAVTYGTGGIAYYDVARELVNESPHPLLLDFVAGIGGRDITVDTINRVAEQALAVSLDGRRDDVTWVDANKETLAIWGLALR